MSDRGFWALVDASGGPLACWPWKGRLDKDGYGVWGRKRAHRVAYEEGRQCVLTPIAVVRHRCDFPRCCNPLHLLGGTQEMNVADRVERGRSAKGTTNGRNQLDPGQVLYACYCGLSQRVVAAQLGVNHTTVRDIRRGRIWGWLTGVNSHGGPNRSHG